MMATTVDPPDTKPPPKENTHFNGRFSRKIAETLLLLEATEFCDMVQAVTTDAAVPTTLRGWDTGIRCKKSRAPNSQEKRKKPTLDTGNEMGINYVTSNIQSTKNPAGAIDVSEVGYFSTPVWRSCVESDTYRYIPNNGRYRAAKVVAQKVGYQKVVPRKPGDKFLSVEQKELQREIQRELRREFEMMHTQGQWAKTGVKSGTEKSHRRKRDFTPSSKIRDHVDTPEAKRNSVISHSSNSIQSSADTRASPVKTQEDSENRLSYFSNDILVNAGTIQRHPRRLQRTTFSPIELPPIAIPLVKTSQTNNKVPGPANDSLASHLNPLEERYRKEGMNRKPQQALDWVRKTRSHSEPPPSSSRNKDITNLNPSHESSRQHEQHQPKQLRQHYRPVKGKTIQGSGATREDDQEKMYTKLSIIICKQKTCDMQGPCSPKSCQSPSRTGKSVTSDISTSASASPLHHPPASPDKIRFMNASGHVSTTPHFGKKIEPSENVDSTLKIEKGTQDLSSYFQHKTHETTMECYVAKSCVGSPHTKVPMSGRLESQSVPSQVLSKTESLHVSENLKDMQVRGKNKKKMNVMNQGCEVLPEISGRKVNIAMTTHRIV